MNVELHSGTKPHSDVKLQKEIEAHYDSDIGGNVELPDRGTHNDSNAKRKNEEIKTEPRFSKYVKRCNLATQIIGDKDARPMKRNKLRNDTCLLSMKEPKLVKDAL